MAKGPQRLSWRLPLFIWVVLAGALTVKVASDRLFDATTAAAVWISQLPLWTAILIVPLMFSIGFSSAVRVNGWSMIFTGAKRLWRGIF